MGAFLPPFYWDLNAAITFNLDKKTFKRNSEVIKKHM